MLTSPVIRRRETKTTVRYYYASISKCKTKRRGHGKCWGGCGATGALRHCWWKLRLQALRKTSEQSLAKLNATLLWDPAILTLRHSPKENENTGPNKDLYINARGSFDCNTSKLETAQMATTGKWINKLGGGDKLWYTQHGKLQNCYVNQAKEARQ